MSLILEYYVIETASWVKMEHGCQLIINGVIPTLKYYLRLITSLDNFMGNYNKAIEIDKELKKAHKDKWNELIEKYFRHYPIKCVSFKKERKHYP